MIYMTKTCTVYMKPVNELLIKTVCLIVCNPIAWEQKAIKVLLSNVAFIVVV